MRAQSLIRCVLLSHFNAFSQDKTVTASSATRLGGHCAAELRFCLCSTLMKFNRKKEARRKRRKLFLRIFFFARSAFFSLTGPQRESVGGCEAARRNDASSLRACEQQLKAALLFVTQYHVCNTYYVRDLSELLHSLQANARQHEASFFAVLR